MRRDVLAPPNRTAVRIRVEAVVGDQVMFRSAAPLPKRSFIELIFAPRVRRGVFINFARGGNYGGRMEFPLERVDLTRLREPSFARIIRS